MAKIMSTTEVESALVYFEKTYPSLCRRIELPNKTIENRTVHALELGTSQVWGTPTGLVIGGVHAREWGGPDIVVNFAGDLLRAYTAGKGLKYNSKSFSASVIQRLLNESTIVVFPCVNPDGVEYSHKTEPYWRKNRNPASSGGVPSRVGVDINRNYDFVWDYKQHFHPSAWKQSLASEDPSAETFHGLAPFSEPETRNVRWLMAQYSGLSMFLDLHSYAGSVLYNWGDDNNQNNDSNMIFFNPSYDGQRGTLQTGYGEFISSSDESIASGTAEDISQAMNAVWGRQYKAEQAVGLYPTSGASDDYAFSRSYTNPLASKTFGFTLEFNFEGEGFHATADPNVLDRAMMEVIPGLITFALRVKRRRVPRPFTEEYVTNIIHVNPFTGEIWYIGGDGKIHKKPPPPDPYRTPVANEIWRLLGAYESLLEIPGEAGEMARSALLKSIEVLAARAGKGPIA